MRDDRLPHAASRPRGRRLRSLGGLALALVAVAAVAFVVRSRRPTGLTLHGVKVVHTFPHDAAAYTQGLLFHDGRFYESTGRHGISSVREVAVESGEVLRRTELPYRLFGEGLALHGDLLYQLTWNAGEVRVYDRATLAFLRKYGYPGEGWGLASDGERMFLSDGTSTLRLFDPATWTEVGRLEVVGEDGPVTYINELEFVDGELFANIWKTDWIARIDPATGAVTGWIDLTGLLAWPDLPDAESVPNGIAWDAAGERLFLTGKLWPSVFEVELVPLARPE